MIPERHPFFLMIAVGITIAFFMLSACQWLGQILPFHWTSTPAPTNTQKQTSTPMPTPTLTPTLTLTPMHTPTWTPMLTLTPTPTLTIGSTQISSKDGMVMVYVPEGFFTMGSDAYPDEQPVHKVWLDAFWIDQTEVTNVMFTKFVQATGYQTDAERMGWSWVFAVVSTGAELRQVDGADWRYPRGPGSSLSGLDNSPVVQVSWIDAKAYCRWSGRRLPKEAEWEKAARGTNAYIYPWGNDAPNGKLLNFNMLVGDTTAVGSYPAGASPYGVLDMAGNVWEWVFDWYSDTYYSQSPENNPTGPGSGEHRVLRGGSWNEYRFHVRSALRYWVLPIITDDLSINIVGFRCALSQ